MRLKTYFQQGRDKREERRRERDKGEERRASSKQQAEKERREKREGSKRKDHHHYKGPAVQRATTQTSECMRHCLPHAFVRSTNAPDVVQDSRCVATHLAESRYVRGATPGSTLRRRESCSKDSALKDKASTTAAKEGLEKSRTKILRSAAPCLERGGAERGGVYILLILYSPNPPVDRSGSKSQQSIWN